MASRWQSNYQLYRRYLRNLSILYNKRQDVQTYVELLLTLSVIIIFALFAIRPTIVTITELFAQIEDKKVTIGQLDQKIDALTQAQSLYDANRVKLALVDTAIPSDPLPELFTRQFEGLTVLNQTTLVNVNVGEATIFGTSTEGQAAIAAAPTDEIVEVDPYPQDAKVLEYAADIGGSYFNLVALMEDIESMRRPVFLDELVLRIAGGDAEQELILSISGRVPYLKLDE